MAPDIEAAHRLLVDQKVRVFFGLQLLFYFFSVR